jgi:hypothetical protein
MQVRRPPAEIEESDTEPPPPDADTMDSDPQEDAVTLKHLKALEEVVSIPSSEGGFDFSDWEREFLVRAREHHDETLGFTKPQRDEINRIWRLFHVQRRQRRPALDHASNEEDEVLPPYEDL